MIPTPYLDELKRLCQDAEDYAAENAEQLTAEKKLLQEAKQEAQRKAQDASARIKVMDSPKSA